MFCSKTISETVFVYIVQAKVNNSSQIGLGYSQKLRDGKLISLLSIKTARAVVYVCVCVCALACMRACVCAHVCMHVTSILFTFPCI